MTAYTAIQIRDCEALESIFKAYDKSTNGGGANTFVANLVIAIDQARQESRHG